MQIIRIAGFPECLKLVTVRKNKIENLVRDRITPPDLDYKAQNWASSKVLVGPAENLLINIRRLSKRENTRDIIK